MVMVSHNITLVIALLAPIAALTLLRINAVMVFLSLCLGAVVLQFVGGEATSMVTLFSSKAGSVSGSTLRIGLLLLPALLTSVFMVFSVHGRTKLLLNLLPATGVALLALFLVVPELAPTLRESIESEQLWTQLWRMQALLVGVSAMVSVVALWMQRKRGSARRAEH